MKTLLSLSLVMLLATTACDDDDSPEIDAAPPADVIDGGEDVIDAGFDAAPSVFGSWKLDSVQRDGIEIVADVDEPAPLLPGLPVVRRVNGLLQLDERLEQLSFSEVHLVGTSLDIEFTRAVASSLVLAESVLTAFDLDFTVGWSVSAPDQLTLTEVVDGKQTPVIYSLSRHRHEASDTFTLTGLAYDDTKGSLTAPHVALVSVLRNTDGSNGYFVVDSAGEAGNDAELGGEFGTGGPASIDFELSRSTGALGVEDIGYGSGFVAVLLVVAYDDKDGDGLDPARIGDPDCSGKGDCVHGVSQLGVAYRFGGSAQLDESPFNLLLPGWQPIVFGFDLRTGVPTPVSMDPTRPVTVEVRFGDPGSVELPSLVFELAGTPTGP